MTDAAGASTALLKEERVAGGGKSRCWMNKKSQGEKEGRALLPGVFQEGTPRYSQGPTGWREGAGGVKRKGDPEGGRSISITGAVVLRAYLLDRGDIGEEKKERWK